MYIERTEIDVFHPKIVLTVLGIVALVLALLFVFLLFPQIVLGDGVRDIGADERKICRDPLHPIHNNKLLSRPRKEKTEYICQMHDFQDAKPAAFF